MRKSVLVSFCLCWMVSGVAVAADHRAEMFRRMGLALAEGQCSVITQKEFRTTADGGTTGSYIADSVKLHQCQYVREMAVGTACMPLGKCPTYEEWSRANPEFSPSQPRSVFVSELEKRQNMVSALRSVSKF